MKNEFKSNNYGTVEVLKIANGMATIRFLDTGNVQEVNRPVLYTGLFADKAEWQRRRDEKALEAIARSEAREAKRVAKAAAYELRKRRLQDHSHFIGQEFESTNCGTMKILAVESFGSVTVQFIQTGYTTTSTLQNIQNGYVRDNSVQVG